MLQKIKQKEVLFFFLSFWRYKKKKMHRFTQELINDTVHTINYRTCNLEYTISV